MEQVKISYQLGPIGEKPRRIGDKDQTPKELDFWLACKNVSNNRPVYVEAGEFAEKVCKGQSWYCGTFNPTANGQITNASIASAQAISLDIDNDREGIPVLTVEAAKQRLKELELCETVIYPSFSNGKIDDKGNIKQKYRIVFFLNNPISRDNIRKWYVLADMLYTLFPEADPASLTISQLWLGTNQPPFSVVEGSRLNEQALYDAYIKVVWDSVDDTNRSKKWVEKAAQWGVNLNENGLPYLLMEEDNKTVSPRWIDDKIAVEHMGRTPTGRVSKSKTIKGKNPERVSEGRTVELTKIANWVDRARRISFVFFAGFENGKRIMRRYQRHFLISNLAAINGGQKYYYDVLEKNIDLYEHDMEYYRDEADRFLKRYTGIMRWTDTIKGEMYDTAMEYNSLYEAIVKSDRPSIYEKRGKISVEEANMELRTLLGKVLNDRSKGIYGINADTGSGKTKAYIDYIVENRDKIGRVLICVPTHNLKREIADRFEKSGIRVCELEKRPDVGDDCEEKADYWKSLRVGFNSKAQSIWNKYFDKVKAKGFKHPKYREYILYDGSVQLVKGSQVVITTHDLSLYTELEGDFDIVIYDEDICHRMVEIKETTIDDVRDFIKGFPAQVRFRDMLNRLEQSNADRRNLHNPKTNYETFMTTEKANWDIDLSTMEMKNYRGGIPNTDVFSFLHAKSYTMDYNGRIMYSYVRSIGYNDATVLVLSATLSPLIFGKLTVGRYSRFFQIEHIRNKGTIIQDISRTYSKSHLEDNHERIIEELNTNYPDWKDRYLITFKDWIKFFKGQGAKFYNHNDNDKTPMTFGNTEGIDALKGEKILILGKFGFPEHIYLLWATALNIPIMENGDHQYTQYINHNGYSFRLFTYEQEELRRIQLYLIESELEQATGRGRAVWYENADVLVLCDIPLNSADKMVYRGNDIREGIEEIPTETYSREIEVNVYGNDPIRGIRPKVKAPTVRDTN